MNEVSFPLYFRTQDERSWYRIDDHDHLFELQLIGKMYLIHQIEARILPERNLILDIIENKEGRWVSISASQFDEVLNNAKANLSPASEL